METLSTLYFLKNFVLSLNTYQRIQLSDPVIKEYLVTLLERIEEDFLSFDQKNILKMVKISLGFDLNINWKKENQNQAKKPFFLIHIFNFSIATVVIIFLVASIIGFLLSEEGFPRFLQLCNVFKVKLNQQHQFQIFIVLFVSYLLLRYLLLVLLTWSSGWRRLSVIISSWRSGSWELLPPWRRECLLSLSVSFV